MSLISWYFLDQNLPNQYQITIIIVHQFIIALRICFSRTLLTLAKSSISLSVNITFLDFGKNNEISLIVKAASTKKCVLSAVDIALPENMCVMVFGLCTLSNAFSKSDPSIVIPKLPIKLMRVRKPPSQVTIFSPLAFTVSTNFIGRVGQTSQRV